MLAAKKFFYLVLLSLVLSQFSFILIRAEDLADEETEGTERSNTAEEKPEESSGEYATSVLASPDVQTAFLFTSEGLINRNEIIAGKIVKFLIGFSNRGEKDFIVKHCETSFRYPLDFSYYVQNFSAVVYGRLVQPKQEGSFDYAFIASDAFIGRPLGLVVNLHYMDTEGSSFVSNVFNETVTITEDESSFQTETYFLYVILIGFAIFILFIIQNFLSKFTRKSAMTYQPVYEMGTNKNQVDYEWIPRSHLEPRKSPKMGSPRSRKSTKSVS